MRHDEHYVEALAASASSPIGRLLPIDQIDPNPNQPRQVMGDLSELVASVGEKGILEPILVRRRQGRFQIVAGERRYQAAIQAGLIEVPAIIRDMEDDEVTEIALIENLQRKDLTPFEEAEALSQLSERGGLTHDQIAKRLGKSRTAVTETLTLNQMPEDVRNLCRLADIHSKSLLLQIVRQSDHDKMVALIERASRQVAGEHAVTRESLKAGKKKLGRPKAFVFQYKAPTKAFSLRLNFRKADVPKDEVISALEAILSDLRSAR
jgi:ParB family chromosome partitioning protein